MDLFRHISTTHVDLVVSITVQTLVMIVLIAPLMSPRRVKMAKSSPVFSELSGVDGKNCAVTRPKFDDRRLVETDCNFD